MNWQLDQDITEASEFATTDKVFGHQSDGNARVWTRNALSDAALSRIGIIPVETEAELIAAIADTEDLGETYPFGPIIQLPWSNINITQTITISSRHSFVLQGYGPAASILIWTGSAGEDMIVLERNTNARLMNFSIQAGSGDLARHGITLKQTAAAGSVGLESENCYIYRVGALKFENAFYIDSTAETGDPQNGYHTFEECKAQNCKISFMIESTTAYQTVMNNCTTAPAGQFNVNDTIGVYGKSSNYWSWYNGQGTNNGYDFKFGSATDRGPCLIEGHRSENSLHFVGDENSTLRDATPTGSHLTIRDVTWDGRPTTDMTYALDANVDFLIFDCAKMAAKIDHRFRAIGGTVTHAFIGSTPSGGQQEQKHFARRNNSGGIRGMVASNNMLGSGNHIKNYQSAADPDFGRQTLSLPKTTFAAGETSAIAWPFTFSAAASGTFTVDTGTDVITSASHGQLDRRPLYLTTSGSLPGGFSAETIYWMINKTNNTFQLSAEYQQAAVDITTTGSGTHTWTRHLALYSFSFAFDVKFDDLTAAAGYANRHAIAKVTGLSIFGQTGDLALTIGGSPLVMSLSWDTGAALENDTLTVADPGWSTGVWYRVVFVYDADERIYQTIVKVGDAYGGGIDNDGTLGADDGELRPTGERLLRGTSAPGITIGGGLFDATIANGSYWERALSDDEVALELLGGNKPVQILAV